MGFPAARVADLHVCPMVTGVVPHVGGPIVPPCAPTVFVGGMPQARMGDLLTCVGPPDVIVKGSSGVFVMGKPAARLTDTCAHGGAIVVGCITVLIGETGSGGGVPASLSPAGARDALGQAAFPGQQNFNNCGVQSSGEVIFLATGKRMPEAALLQESIAAGRAGSGVAGDPASPGGTMPAQRQAILQAHGVPSDIVPTTRDSMGNAIRDGRGVIVNVDAGTLWNDPAQSGGHAVVVTGGTFDPNGRLDTVTVNDTGTGQRSTMPADHMLDAANARPGGSSMNVTSNPILPPNSP